MNKAEIKTKTEALLEIRCAQELKDVAAKWLAALDTADEQAATDAYIAELKEDIMTVDDVIAFFSSPAAAERFGADKAAEIAESNKKANAEGAVYCGCPACTAALEILNLLEA